MLSVSTLTKSIILVGSLVLCGSAAAQKAPTPVFVTTVQLQAFSDQIEALGTLQANENVDLTSPVTEAVTKVNFNDGQRVKQGDILVEMDSAEESALLAEEQSRLDEAQRRVDRLKPLLKSGSASRAAYDTAELNLMTSKARIDAIKSRIAQRTILAPFDGVVGLRNISVGAVAQTGRLITTIDDDTTMKLDFSVPDVFLSTLESGLVIEAKSKAWPGQIFKGTVASVDSRVDPQTRSIVARAILENASQQLKPGLLMRVTLKKNPRQTILIPEEAILIQATKTSVFVVNPSDEGDTVERVEVELGARRKGEVEILKGLSVGDQIVTHGTLRVRSGSRVTVKAQDTGEEPLSVLLQGGTEKAVSADEQSSSELPSSQQQEGRGE